MRRSFQMLTRSRERNTITDNKNMNQFNSKNNIAKLTCLSYALTCLTGIVVIIPFVITQPAANYFHTTLDYIGFIFSFFMFGMMVAQFLNGYFVKYMSVRLEIMLCSLIYLFCSILLFFIHATDVLIPILLIIGFCFGMIVTLPNFIIVRAFKGKDRSSKLNRLDFFFSVGSLIYPIIVGWMLTHHSNWQSVYLSVVIVFLAVVALTSQTILPNVSEKKSDDHDFSPWNAGVWLVGFAIFLYFMSYVGYTYWISNQLTQNHLSAEAADFGVSLFWITYAIGCFISSIAVRHIAVNNYIIFSAIIALIAYYVIDIATSTVIAYAAISLLGLGCATVYSSSIAYGTHLVERASPRIVAFFITLSGIGTYLGQVYSSWAEGRFGLHSIVIFSALFMFAAIVVYSGVSIAYRKIQYQDGNSRSH